MPAGALTWDGLAERYFETGVDHGVLYHQTGGVYNDGEAWNGLITVTESPSGAESNKKYADNIPYLNLFSAEEFGATIECFTAPNGFLTYDGVRKTANGLQITQQSRPVFGFSWRTKKGNGLDEDLGYILHLAYGLQASPSEKTRTTVNDSPEPTTFSWTITSTPVEVPGFKPTAVVHIDSTDPDVDPTNLAALEEVLYGKTGVAPRLPLPAEVDTILGTGIIEVTPEPLAYNSSTHTITYVAQPGVVYRREDTGAAITANVVLTAGQSLIVTAEPANGYNFDGVFVDRWLYEY